MRVGFSVVRTGLAVATAIFLMALSPRVTSAQLLYSFETADNPATPAVNEALEGWDKNASFCTAVSWANSTEAATSGTHGLKIEDTTGYQWDLSVTVNSADTVRYPMWNAVAANPAGYSLDLDVMTTADSFAHITPAAGGYVLFDVSVSSDAGWHQSLNLAPPGNIQNNLANPVQTYHVSVPMKDLVVAPNAGYYQLSVGTNSNFTPGASGEGFRYYLDNIHFTALAPPKQTVTQTLFSWETPDNSSTPTVDERFEGWTEGYQFGHTHSIVTSPAHGPTEGTHALNIHRVDLDNAPDGTGSSYFTWGSQYVLNSDPNQNGQIDTAIQQKIDSLVGKLNSATRIAFDVSFDPNDFDASPTYARFGLRFEDGTHGYQSEFPFFAPLNASGPTTISMELPATAFTGNGTSLGQTGLTVGTHGLRILMSTNVNGLFVAGASAPIDFQVDNFRLITEISGVPGDYNNNGVVDMADYITWRKAMASPGTQLLNEVANTSPGTVAADDYTAWRARLGNTSGSGSGLGGAAVPEPAGIALLGLAGLAMPWCRRRISGN